MAYDFSHDQTKEGFAHFAQPGPRRMSNLRCISRKRKHRSFINVYPLFLAIEVKTELLATRQFKCTLVLSWRRMANRKHPYQVLVMNCLLRVRRHVEYQARMLVGRYVFVGPSIPQSHDPALCGDHLGSNACYLLRAFCASTIISASTSNGSSTVAKLWT